MTKLTLEQQELLFANDCKLINLRYEYHGYTGTEKWAIVTELAEEELWVKYPDVIRRLTSHTETMISTKSEQKEQSMCTAMKMTSLNSSTGN